MDRVTGDIYAIGNNYGVYFGRCNFVFLPVNEYFEHIAVAVNPGAECVYNKLHGWSLLLLDL
jgi:hypothetical protein